MSAYGEFIGKKLKSFKSRRRAILINDINNLIFKTEMSTQTLQVEESRQLPNISSFSTPGTSYQQPQFPIQSLESLYGNLYQKPPLPFLPRINNQSQTEPSP